VCNRRDFYGERDEKKKEGVDVSFLGAADWGGTEKGSGTALCAKGVGDRKFEDGARQNVDGCGVAEPKKTPEQN